MTTDLRHENGVRPGERRADRGDDERLRDDSSAHGDDARLRDTDAVIAPDALRTRVEAGVRADASIAFRWTGTRRPTTCSRCWRTERPACGLAATAFEDALTEVLESLARQIVEDGEGAKKLVTIDMEGATSERAAEKIARSIANSPLVKTAIAGSDPNWGRILSAAGNAGVAFDPRRVDIDLQGVRGVPRAGLAGGFFGRRAEGEAG